MTSGLMKYKRVAQRLREKYEDIPVSIKQIEDVIFVECGTDPRTVKSAMDRLIRLDLIELIKEENRVFGVSPISKYKVKKVYSEHF